MLGVSAVMLVLYISVWLKPRNAVRTRLPGHVWEPVDLECKDIEMERIAAECTDRETSADTEEETEAENTEEDDLSGVVRQKAWEPTFYCNLNKEVHYYAGHEIRIYESLDSYGAIIWPAGLALCQYLDSNRRTINLQDKAVLELGAGTGLVSIVASLLGAWVTASDLPEVLGNLRCNLCRNTRGHCRYTPQVAALSWGFDLERTFPRSVYRYDYVLAADVVYHHDFLDELLATMCHFCQPGTTLIWANKIRFTSDLVFTENFEKSFSTTLLADMGEIKIYSATAKDVEVESLLPVMLLEDAVKRGKKSEECNFLGEVSKKTGQYPALEVISRDTKQRIVSGTGEGTEGNCEGEYKEESYDSERNEQLVFQRSCTPSTDNKLLHDIYDVFGHEICIEKSNGDITSPAAVALCKFLETPAGQEQIVLLDRTVLDLRAGTGLLSVVATLLGARVTATDRSESLENLRSNLHRNTRGRQRHKPQVTALPCDLRQHSPHSKCHYDYVLAAEVLSHHDRFAKLLVTMRHFCQPGTNLIWAIKLCHPSDLVFIEDFRKAFHAAMLAELDGVRIYVATRRAEDHGDDPMRTEEEMEKCHTAWNYTNEENPTKQRTQKSNGYGVDSTRDEGQCDQAVVHHQQEEEEREEYTGGNDMGYGRSGEWEESQVHGQEESFSTDDSDEQVSCQEIWESKYSYFSGNEVHYFMGHRIIIEESFDSYGAMIWPAAVALCKFLETPAGREQINLLDKTVLEIGAGTGLLSIVITLLGAKLTATDLPEILSNLRHNLRRNTRSLRRHEPQVKELSWGYELEKTFPRSSHHYEYVLAADVVYHHDFLDELLATMRHFCQPGTTLIWANKIRYPSDLTFLESFENLFHTTLLAELEEVRIYRATYKSLPRDKEE